MATLPNVWPRNTSFRCQATCPPNFSRKASTSTIYFSSCDTSLCLEPCLDLRALTNRNKSTTWEMRVFTVLMVARLIWVLLCSGVVLGESGVAAWWHPLVDFVQSFSFLEAADFVGSDCYQKKRVKLKPNETLKGYPISHTFLLTLHDSSLNHHNKLSNKFET